MDSGIPLLPDRVRVVNELTGEYWDYENPFMLYKLSNNFGWQFGLVGRQWKPGVYRFDNGCVNELKVLMGTTSYVVRPMTRAHLVAHKEV